MSLDIDLRDPTATYESAGYIFWLNITHNLGMMAREAWIYECLWWAQENKYTAQDLIDKLTPAIEDMKNRKDHYIKFNPENWWWSYDAFIPRLEELLEMCKQYPKAIIKVSK